MMKWLGILLLCYTVSGRISHRSRRNGEDEEEDRISVIVGMKAEDRPRLVSRIAERLRSGKLFNRINAISMDLTLSELEAMQQDPDVLYIEEDGMVYPDAEAVDYGQSLIQARSDVFRAANFTIPSSAACNNPKSFKIGIIDSGLDVNHPDIPCLPIDDANTNCIGAEFGVGENDGVWHNPINKYHGTHVAGVIGARGDNGFGMQGIIPDGNFCFLIGRVFGESGRGTKMSSIFAAVEWMVDQGANVINMSLGTGVFNTGGSPLMQSAYDAGVLLIAASGNGGNADDHYPANFDNVLSVAAVDENLQWAYFSQYNAGVDITAPGVEILSTFPTGSGEVALVSYEELGGIGQFMKNSVNVDSFSGSLVACPNFGQGTCPGNGGHVCLIERGVNKFEEKALNCESSGAIAAIIYNNETGTIGGGLATPTKVTIPVLDILANTAQHFFQLGIGKVVHVETKAGYGYSSGTSMAAPFVTGVASKLWRNCPKCTNRDIEGCLLNTTVDLGPSGKDVKYGHGLVQAEATLVCLRDTVRCCGKQETTDETGKLKPSPTPIASSMPSRTPFSDTSSKPVDVRSRVLTSQFEEADKTSQFALHSDVHDINYKLRES